MTEKIGRFKEKVTERKRRGLLPPRGDDKLSAGIGAIHRHVNYLGTCSACLSGILG